MREMPRMLARHACAARLPVWSLPVSAALPALALPPVAGLEPPRLLALCGHLTDLILCTWQWRSNRARARRSTTASWSLSMCQRVVARCPRTVCSSASDERRPLKLTAEGKLRRRADDGCVGDRALGSFGLSPLPSLASADARRKANSRIGALLWASNVTHRASTRQNQARLMSKQKWGKRKTTNGGHKRRHK